MVRVAYSAAERRALAALVSRVHRRQLFTEPWRSTLVVVLVGTGTSVAGLIWLTGGPMLGGYMADAAAMIGVVLLAATATMGPATRLMLARGRSRDVQGWLLETRQGAAGLVVRDVQTRVWRPVSAVAHPPQQGLGRLILRQLLARADAAGATLRISCTTWLEPAYARHGFVTTRRWLLWRSMERRPADTTENAD